MTIVHHLISRPALQAILYLPAILGLIILVSISIRWSLADVYATQVSHHLETVNRDSSNKSAEQWGLARQHLDSALGRRPAYARYFELAEKFYQKLDGLESRRIPLTQEQAWNDNESKALDYARRGLRMTPSWPYLWNRLVISKMLLKQFDSELTGSIERTVHLGSWEQPLQYGVAMLGLSGWPNLHDTARLHVIQAMEQTLAMAKTNPNKLYDTKKMMSHGNFTQACEIVVKDTSKWQLYSLYSAVCKDMQ